ncbi:MAG: AraC family transcriptional regulator [Pseudomonadota bacterium]
MGTNDRTGRALQSAVDFIEDNLSRDLALADIAASAHLSVFHFARLFRSQTGMSPLGYLRARRFSQATRSLRETALPIAEVAQRCGFKSQQSFTAAFSQRFSTTPAKFRKQPFTVHVMEKLDMSQRYQHIPRGPDFRRRDGFTVVGMALKVDAVTKTQIPALWQRFGPTMHSIPGWDGKESFGACYGMDQNTGVFTYLAGVATEATVERDDFEVCVIPSADYAVFTHEGSLGHIQDTVGYIFGEWLPGSDYELAGSPDFELYDSRFDPVADKGELEYWIPIQPKPGQAGS